MVYPRLPSYFNDPFKHSRQQPPAESGPFLDRMPWVCVCFPEPLSFGGRRRFSSCYRALFPSSAQKLGKTNCPFGLTLPIADGLCRMRTSTWGSPVIKRKIWKVLAAYERVGALNPGYLRAQTNLGLLYRERGEIEPAVRSFEKALFDDPESLATLNNLGLTMPL